MGCFLEFSESLIRVEFFSEKSKQKILIDILTKYGELDADTLASILDISVEHLEDICAGNSFLAESCVDSLSQLFLMFLGKHFFRKCTFIRNFAD